MEGDDESTAYGAQILVKRDRVSAGLTGQMVHADASDQLNPAAQGDVELTVVDEGRALGLLVSLTAAGAVAITRREGNEAVATAIAEVRLIGDGEERFSISLQGLGNYGVSWASGGEARSGPVIGIGTSLVLTRSLGIEAEYDLDSSYGEEDSWEARVLISLPAPRYQPALAVGGGKHAPSRSAFSSRGSPAPPKTGDGHWILWTLGAARKRWKPPVARGGPKRNLADFDGASPVRDRRFLPLLLGNPRRNG